MKTLEEAVRQQAAFACSTTYENLPEEVVQRAKWVILDSIGCMLKGKECFPKMEGQSSLLRYGVQMIHTELYEGNRKGIGHPACHILPLLLSEGEKRTIEEKDFLRIFVVSYEIASRWGRGVTFSHDVLGHGTVMTTGAIVARGLLEEFSEEEMYQAILMTASMPEVSVWQSVFDGSGLHDAYAAVSAEKTVCVSQMVKAGIFSTADIVSDVYEKIMGATICVDQLVDGLGEDYLLCSNYFKVHTGCRFIHPFADVLQEELANGLKPERLDQVLVYTYKKAAKIKDESVPNELAGKFSIPVSLAVQLVYGQLTPDSIRHFDAPEVLAWEGRIHLYEEDTYNELLPDIRGGRVEFYQKDGTVRKREVFHAVGDFDHPNPFTKTDLLEKFKKNIENIEDKELGITLASQFVEKTDMATGLIPLVQYFYKQMK